MSNPNPIVSARSERVPFWRDVRVLGWAFQFAVLIVVVAIIGILTRNLFQSLDEIGLNLSFNFLSRPAGFNISEGLPFDRQSSIWDAYVVGVVNTIAVSVLGIILATAVGVLVGVARLSSNWLVRAVSLSFVELMQNIPVLVQLFFWFLLIRSFPPQNPDTIIAVPGKATSIGSLNLPVLGYFSQRGAAVVGLDILDVQRFWIVFGLGVLAGIGAWRYRIVSLERHGRPPTHQIVFGATAAALVWIVGWLVTGGFPFMVSFPQLVGNQAGTIYRYEGGIKLTNNFQALLIGLVLYTGAFIAEAVRSGIQAVQYGQIEAATALGLTRDQRLNLIILPQAMRVIIPPLINQYLNLVKNTSLAIAVAYPDLFNISQTIGNQTGQNTQVILMVMATYLMFSLAVSALLNWVNARMQFKER